ncbi:Protein SAR DEFICIENT 1 [Trifolium repens]|nr:Protein SAR DEFICIENT 1 [Trifolium repens]
MQNILSGLEPLLRRVVNEEVERAIGQCYPSRSITKSLSLRLKAVEEPLNFEFIVAVRIAPGTNQSVRVREGMTEPFVVKDHRGELYKKHHPPNLKYEVWRLEKIGKDGAFHKKLTKEGITTIQEFLKLSVVDPQRLFFF